MHTGRFYVYLLKQTGSQIDVYGDQFWTIFRKHGRWKSDMCLEMFCELNQIVDWHSTLNAPVPTRNALALVDQHIVARNKSNHLQN